LPRDAIDRALGQRFAGHELWPAQTGSNTPAFEAAARRSGECPIGRFAIAC
jgi:hypothetical protein